MIPDLNLPKASACFVLLVFATGQVATIDATAPGTSTQMGALASVRVISSQFSTTEDKG